MNEYEKRNLADEALDAACLLIQERLGVTDGGLAGIVFSDSVVRDAFENYITEELKQQTIELQEKIIRQIQKEVEEDIAKGLVPDLVKTFSELHDFRDANCYGGLCDDEFADSLIKHFGGRDEHEGMPDAMMNFLNEIQTSVDQWLSTRGLDLTTESAKVPGNKLVGFEHNGIWITNPFVSECGRFAVDPVEYGFEPSSTGGGFNALFKAVDGGSIMLTDSGDQIPSSKTPPENIIIGLYDSNGVQIRCNALADAIRVQNIEATPMADIVNGKSYAGTILDMDDHVVVQKIGRNGETVAHDRAKLTDVPEIGAVVEIKYVGGQGQVMGKDKSKSLGR